jgi:Protein of unknown function (DUF2842)
MSMRMRKFIGIFATVSYIIAYALVVMALGGQYVVGSGFFIELPFYILGGIAWIPPAAMIIKWMARPDINSR